jgi:HAD superfamily phosphatase (TIGR01668 family)
MKKNKHTLNYLLTPDYIFPTFADITPDFLLSHGIKALVIDVDNTLAPYEQELPDQKTVDWFKNLSENGIKAALISNNKPERIEKYNALLSLPAYPDSKKPSTKAILRAIEEMGATLDSTAGLGDQLLTDTLAVHRLDMMSIIVPPIKDKKTLFFRFKRLLEKPFIARYYKKSKANEVISK